MSWNLDETPNPGPPRELQVFKMKVITGYPSADVALRRALHVPSKYYPASSSSDPRLPQGKGANFFVCGHPVGVVWEHEKVDDWGSASKYDNYTVILDPYVDTLDYDHYDHWLEPPVIEWLTEIPEEFYGVEGVF